MLDAWPAADIGATEAECLPSLWFSSSAVFPKDKAADVVAAVGRSICLIRAYLKEPLRLAMFHPRPANQLLG